LSNAAPPRILIADDHPVVCEGLRSVLEPDHSVVGVVHDGREVRAAVRELRPDLVLLEVSLPGKNGIEVARELRSGRRRVKTLILTAHNDTIFAIEALAAGAAGFILKQASTRELTQAIAAILAGGTYVDPIIARKIDAGETEGAASRGGDLLLTMRQREVLRLLAFGRSTSAIAKELDITTKAVEFHRTRIKRALGVSTTAAVVGVAIAHGLAQL
jgi:DNA-binding NarL/FixJ family response regulator